MHAGHGGGVYNSDSKRPLIQNPRSTCGVQYYDSQKEQFITVLNETMPQRFATSRTVTAA
jgi:hypothetical protein